MKPTYYVFFVSSTDSLKMYFTLSDGVSNCPCESVFQSGEMEAVPLTAGQSKNRAGRIHCVSARELLLVYERNAENNYYGAKHETRNLAIFTFTQAVRVSTCLRYLLSALAKFLCLHMFFFRIQYASVHLTILSASTNNLCFIPLLCQDNDLESDYIEKLLVYSNAQ